MPEVSVVIPVYNREEYIGECLQSVFDQTLDDWNIWVVDDGSTDHTLEVVHSFDRAKVHVLQVEHGRQARARNAAIAHIDSEFVAFLDSDDVWLPNKLERQLPLFAGRPKVGLVCSDNYRFDAHGRHTLTTFQFKAPHRGRVLRELCLGPNFVVTSTVVARRECFNRVGLFDPSLTTSEDYHMWLRIAAQYEIDYVPDVLGGYRFHPAQSLKEDEMGNHLREASVLLSIEGLHPELIQSFSNPFHQRVARKAYQAGREAIVNEEWSRAYTALLLSLKHMWTWRAGVCLPWALLFSIVRRAQRQESA